MSMEEWVKSWSEQAPDLPAESLGRALQVLAGKEEGSDK